LLVGKTHSLMLRCYCIRRSYS